jgi:anti-anti-sigma factor
VTASSQGRRFESGLLSIESLLDGDTRTLQLSGELDLATAPILEQALEEALAGEGRIVLDLRQLTFIDSTGIAILINTIELAKQGRDIRFQPSTAPAVTRVLALTGVQERLPLLDSSS